MNPIPQPITVTTGDQHLVRSTIDDFFLETSNFIKLKHDVKPGDLEVKSGELAYDSRTVTDDRITYLSYRDAVVAGVFETRTQCNNVRYSFFRNLENLDVLE